MKSSPLQTAVSQALGDEQKTGMDLLVDALARELNHSKLEYFSEFSLQRILVWVLYAG